MANTDEKKKYVVASASTKIELEKQVNDLIE